MKRLATLAATVALATTLGLALIGMPGGTALAAPLAAELYATINADDGSIDPDDREEGGFGYVVVSKVRGDTVWYVKVENVAKETEYGFFNDDVESEGQPCWLDDKLVIITTDTEGDALVAFPGPKPEEVWVHVCRNEGGAVIKILTGELRKGRGGGRP